MKDNQATAAQREDFERLANGKAACGFKRSRFGTYVNPAIARDWKWFQLGVIAATRDAADKPVALDENKVRKHFENALHYGLATLPRVHPYAARWTSGSYVLDSVHHAWLGYLERAGDEAKHKAARGQVLAPWPDFKGNPIYHGSRLRHPDGTSFVAMRLYGFTQETDAWRAIYDGLEPSGVSRLCLQIGDKGQATIVPEEIPS